MRLFPFCKSSPRTGSLSPRETHLKSRDQSKVKSIKSKEGRQKGKDAKQQKDYKKGELNEKEFKVDQIVKPIKISLSLLQKDVFEANTPQESKQKNFKVFKQCFHKISDEDFLLKLRKIMYIFEKPNDYQLITEKMSQKVHKWLINFFRINKKDDYLFSYNQKFKNFVLKTILKIFNKKFDKIKYPTLYESKECLENWICKFVKKYKLNESYVLKVKREENIEGNFNCQYGRMNIISKTSPMFPRTNKLEKKISELSQKFSNSSTNENNQKSKRKKQIKTLSLEKCKCLTDGCQQQMVEKKCAIGNHMILICQKCNWSQHKCIIQKDFEKEDFQDDIYIMATGQRMKNYTFQRLSKTKTNSNIKQMLRSLGYQFITKPKIIPCTPSKIICNYPILVGKACQEIISNRLQQDYLPLTIKPSTIKGAGLGVFATENIPNPRTLICSYLGEIGMGSVTPATRKYGEKIQMNNSFFTLGWLKNDILLIAPNLFSNVGRFINYNIPSKCNLKPSLCLLQVSKNKYQLAVFLTSTCKILAGQQLFYNYGPDY